MAYPMPVSLLTNYWNMTQPTWYFQSKLILGLWSHKTRPISFTLVVDDFGVKYVGKEHALHLKSVIEQSYCCSADYHHRKVHLSMPGYKDKALK
ncbi:hypothetical protein ACHAW6_001275 [Cyclotella cf. meneghiniana]